MLEIIKNALRVKSDVFDDEILNIINAAKADLIISGINPNTEASTAQENSAVDAMVQQAIILFAKANFGYLDNSEKYERLYIGFKKSMSVTKKYKMPEAESEATQ